MTTTASKLTKGTRYSLDRLAFAGWTGPDAAHADDTLDCWAYFANGVYLGPDADGVEPLFFVAPDATPRLDSLVCWMDAPVAATLVGLLRVELDLEVRVELELHDMRVYVAESDFRVANAAFRGFQLGRDR